MTENESERAAFTVRIEKDTLERFDELAKREDRSREGQVRHLIRQAVAEEAQDANRS